MRNKDASYWPCPRRSWWLRDCFYQQLRTVSERQFEVARPALLELPRCGGYFAVDLGKQPAPDACVDENDAVLTAGLEGSGLSVRTWFGTEVMDGQLVGDLPLYEFQPLVDGGRSFSRPLAAVPLEVGATNPHVTVRHLAHAGAIP